MDDASTLWFLGALRSSPSGKFVVPHEEKALMCTSSRQTLSALGHIEAIAHAMRRCTPNICRETLNTLT